MKKPRTICLLCKCQHLREQFLRTRKQTELTLFRIAVARLEEKLAAEPRYFDKVNCLTHLGEDEIQTLNEVRILRSQANCKQHTEVLTPKFTAQVEA